MMYLLPPNHAGPKYFGGGSDFGGGFGFLSDAAPGVVSLVYAYADRYGISRAYAYWQIKRESGFNPRAVNPTSGAKGLGQFTPGTWKDYGKGKDVFDADANLDAWGRYMSYLLKRYGGSYTKALAAYNAGPGNVDKYKGVPPFKETQAYVSFVTGNAAGAGSPGSAAPAPQNAPQTAAGAAGGGSGASGGSPTRYGEIVTAAAIILGGSLALRML